MFKTFHVDSLPLPLPLPLTEQVGIENIS